MTTSENPSYFKTIVENLNDMILLIAVEPNESFKVLYVNPSFCETSGKNKSIIGEEVSASMKPDDYAALLEHYREAIKTKQIVRWDRVITHPAGENHYSMKLIPVLNAVGDVTQLIAICKEEV